MIGEPCGGGSKHPAFERGFATTSLKLLSKWACAQGPAGPCLTSCSAQQSGPRAPPQPAAPSSLDGCCWRFYYSEEGSLPLEVRVSRESGPQCHLGEPGPAPPIPLLRFHPALPPTSFLCVPGDKAEPGSPQGLGVGLPYSRGQAAEMEAWAFSGVTGQGPDQLSSSPRPLLGPWV